MVEGRWRNAMILILLITKFTRYLNLFCRLELAFSKILVKIARILAEKRLSLILCVLSVIVSIFQNFERTRKIWRRSDVIRERMVLFWVNKKKKEKEKPLQWVKIKKTKQNKTVECLQHRMICV